MPSSEDSKMSLELSKMKLFVLQLQGTRLSLQTCIGALTRAMGDLKRNTETMLHRYEGLLKFEIENIRKDTEDDVYKLSHIVSTTNELALMNKTQLALLANYFNYHSCEERFAHSFSASCSMMMDTTTTDTEEDRQISEYIQDMKLRRAARKKTSVPPKKQH